MAPLPLRRTLTLAMVVILTLFGLLLPDTHIPLLPGREIPVARAASTPAAGAAPWETFVQGVNVATGNLMLQGTGPSIPGVNGFDEVVNPVYNSALANKNVDMGNGWMLNTGRDVNLVVGSSSATFQAPGGYVYTFSEPSSCTFTPPPGLDAQLTCSGSNHVLTMNASGETYTFDSSGYLIDLANREGNTIQFVNGLCRNPAVTTTQSLKNTEGQSTTFGYTDLVNYCLVTSVTDSASRTWTYGYDSNQNLTSVTEPGNQETTFAYTQENISPYGLEWLLTKVTDPNGNMSTVTYDSSGRVTKIVDVSNPGTMSGPTWTFSYGSGSTQVTDPNNHSTTYAFDGSNRVTSVTYPDNTVSHTTWTSDNHIATGQLPSGATTTFSYDGNNNLTQVKLATGATENWAYTNSSFPYLPSSYTDAQGNTSSFQYTGQGLVSTITDPNGKTQTFSYNTNGTVASETDENGHTTSHTYNSLGLPSQDTPPSPLGTTSYTFNSADQEATVTDGKGQLTSMTYDTDGRLTGIGFADHTSIGYSYDQDGNVTGMTDGTGTTTYTYNNLNELTQKTLPNNQTVSYTYDNAGNLATKTDSGGTVIYGYNSNDEVTSVTNRSNAQTAISYDSDGNRTGMSFPNGVTESMTYNSAGQLTTISGVKGGSHGSTTLTSFTYSYTNPNTNQPTELPYSVTDVSGNTTTYTYDNTNELTQALQKSSRGSTLNNWTFGYDPAGNMTSKSVNGTSTTFTYNAANELTQASGGINKTYTYDGNGDLTSISDGTNIALNAAGQITSITPPNSSAINMTYTGVGEQERVTASATSYQYDAAGLAKQTDSSGSTYFTSLPDGELISETASGNTYYYLGDGAGSVAGLTDGTGALADQYSYDPLGNVTSSSGSVSNPFTFQGGIYDSRTGFYYTGSGYYDPSNGQTLGCQDKGWVDPGEDLCGEDESDPSLTDASVGFCGLNGEGREVKGRSVSVRVYGNCNVPARVTIVVFLERQRGPDSWKYFTELGLCPEIHSAGDFEEFSCPPEEKKPFKKTLRMGGKFRVCVKLYVTFADKSLNEKRWEEGVPQCSSEEFRVK